MGGPGDPGPRTFADNVEAAEYGAREWNDYAENLPPEQQVALRDYTEEPPHFPTYQEINGYLRNPTGTAPAEVLRDIAEIDRALAGHPVPEDVLVSRGTNLGHISVPPPALVGTVQRELAYMSTSLGDAAFAGKDAIVNLTVPKGTPALYVENVSAFLGSERELLLGRDLEWRVDAVRFEHGQWIIDGTVLPK